MEVEKEKISSIKHPVVRINPSLDKYRDAPMFQEKVDAARELIERVGLPDLEELKRSRQQHSAD